MSFAASGFGRDVALVFLCMSSGRDAVSDDAVGSDDGGRSIAFVWKDPSIVPGNIRENAIRGCSIASDWKNSNEADFVAA